MNIRIQVLVACLAATPLVARADEPQLVDAAYLDALRAEAQTNHPSVFAAKARVLAAEAGVRSVRLWEDTTAGLSFMAAEREMRAEDGDILFGFEQMLPRRKLYQAQKARAQAERSMFEAETRNTALSVETLVAQSAIELALMDEMLVIETNQFAWLETMAANARERLKDPKGNSSEPLRLESELARERQRIDSTERERARSVRQLNILLGRTNAGTWPRLRLPGSAALTPTLSNELARLQEANPMLQGLLGSSEVAKSEIEVARRERSPAFSVGVDSSVYSGGDYRQTTFGAKMTLPWFNNSVYRANAERARQQQAAAEKEVEALTRRLRGEAVAAHTEVETSALQVKTLAEQVIPRTEKAVEATQNAWITSQASILEVLDARRSLLNARLEERRSVAAHQAALEKLRSIVPPRSHP